MLIKVAKIIFPHNLYGVTLCKAAVCVITILGTWQPITEHCWPGVGWNHKHTQLCTAACLQIVIQRTEMFYLFSKFLCITVKSRVSDRVWVSIRSRIRVTTCKVSIKCRRTAPPNL